MRILLLVILAYAAHASDFVASAQQARVEAEKQLAETRQKIVSERAELTAKLQDLHGQLAKLRSQVDERTRECTATQSDVRQLRKDAERDRQQSDALRKRLDGIGTIDQALSASARLEGSKGVLATRLQALADRLAVSRRNELILSRQGDAVTVPVVRIGDAVAIALGDDAKSRGLLARIHAGSWMVCGPQLPAERKGSIALDVSGTLAHPSTAASRDFMQWMRTGGFFMWPILLVGIAGVLACFERLLWFARNRSESSVVDRFVVSLANGEKPTLAAPRTPIDRVLVCGSQTAGAAREARESALEQALVAEEPRIQRGIGLLAVLAGVAPLLGLLGTVTGMIGMFATIAGHGSGNARLLSGDISVALVTTQFGLIVAVPLLVAHATLARIAEKRQLQLEHAANGLLGATHG